MGEVPTGTAITRSGAQVGDVVAVTGALGGGAGGLALWQQGERDLKHPLLQRYLLPQPRLKAGIALRGLATAAMDISDGLLADLAHLREASQVGVALQPDSLPLAEGLAEVLGSEAALTAALSGGDDYELLVTLPPSKVAQAQMQLAELGLSLSIIGRCTEALGVTGVPVEGATGWQHFRGGAQ
jgi:thiamine-monophosphate kinase